MSRDFSPRECFIANELSGCDLYLQNITYSYGGKTWDIYTEDELADRRAHRYIAICGCDIYGKLKEMLSEDDFEALNRCLKELTEADKERKNLRKFPDRLKDWFYNRSGHHYHEPGDEEFLDFLSEDKTWLNTF